MILRRIWDFYIYAVNTLQFEGRFKSLNRNDDRWMGKSAAGRRAEKEYEYIHIS